LKTVQLDQTTEPIVALVGPSDLNYLIAKFALSDIGFGVLLLSTRLTPEACLKLMKENDCRTVIQAPSRLALNLGDRTHDLDSSVSVYKIATRDIYRDASWDSQALNRSEFDTESASQRTAIVYHSSGSTGLPKSIATTHCKLLAPIPIGKGTTVLTSSPLCHAFASKLTINCMMVEKCMYLTHANMPLTAQTLTEVCRIVQPQVFLTVPYVLKLMAETDDGVSELTKCKSVVSSGSQLSDELGDKLVEAGVNIEVLFAG
jgi:acyl-coenzyme A synthetase/AMP-(fatty) acid ligase